MRGGFTPGLREDDDLKTPPLFCHSSAAFVLGGCNLFSGSPCDWDLCCEDQLGSDGNFAAEPGFCDAESGDYRLCADSLCLPGTHPNGQSHDLVGALGIGCAACGPHVASSRRTWGSVKAMYRQGE
jgi:hypothetical protein